MKTSQAYANVYYEKKRKMFLVFTMGSRSSGRTLLDGPMEITSEQFDSRIGEVLAEALNSYQATTSPERVWLPPEGAGSFIRKHLCVSVHRLESGDLDVIPLHHESGGYVGNEGEHVTVSAADIPTTIASILKNGFSVAT